MASGSWIAQVAAMTQTAISRRTFIQSCAAAALATTSLAQRVQKQSSRSLHLVKQFKGGAFLGGVSTSGKRLCILFVPGGPRIRVEVVEMGTWRVIYSGTFTSNFHVDADFFTSGEALYVNALGPTRGFVVDLHNGRQQERLLDESEPVGYTPLEDGVLLGSARDGSIVRVKLPGYEEMLRLPEPEKSGFPVSQD